MKRVFFILCSSFLVHLTIFAQAPEGRPEGAPHAAPRVNREAFRSRVQEYITKNAELTEEEAKVFFPIYNEYKDAQMEKHKRIHELKKNPPQSDNDADYQEHVMQIALLNAELAQIDRVYYEKLCKAITAKKFFKVLSLEDQMHRDMLRNYNGRRGEARYREGTDPRQRRRHPRDERHRREAPRE